MFHSIAEFLADWKEESGRTEKLMEVLTDASLGQQVSSQDRTLGRIAWHIATSIPEMMKKVGLPIQSLDEEAPLPASAREIQAAYAGAARELEQLIQRDWKDETLRIEDELYGMKWQRGLTLEILIRHEIHHRGQMTVLMRQAGLALPGIYGPSREEWAQYGGNPPEI